MLCEVETDKATIGWEAQEEGFIAAILLQDGSKDIAVGTPAAVIVEEEVRKTVLSYTFVNFHTDIPFIVLDIVRYVVSLYLHQ
jgi:hypothetical protein